MSTETKLCCLIAIKPNITLKIIAYTLSGMHLFDTRKLSEIENLHAMDARLRDGQAYYKLAKFLSIFYFFLTSRLFHHL